MKAAINLPAMALSAAMAFLLVTDDAAIAQAGSTGGTVGKVDKSASGGGQERAPSRVPSTRTRGPRLGNENGSSAAYNGAWVGASFGECIINGWRWKAQVDGRNISGENVTGKVSQGGGVSGALFAFGVTYDFKGLLRSSQGSGTWLVRGGTKAGCAGTWTIVKS
jgi:hypothetical protein